MDKPIILISTGKQNRSARHNEQQAVNTGCNIDYVNAVVLAGGAPVMLPRIIDAAAIRSIAKLAHGIIFTGGGDVVSLNYGEEPHPTSKWTDPSRDTMELELAGAAKELHVPVLGICRGIQILNVAAGGTLIQDIPSQVPEACQHYTDGLDPIRAHNVDVAEGSLAADVLGATRLRVNSYHHQCVDEVGDGLRVTARAFDGVAEAMEATDGRRLLAVQWHPEELAAEDSQCLALFKWIVEEARQFQAGRLAVGVTPAPSGAALPEPDRPEVPSVDQQPAPREPTTGDTSVTVIDGDHAVGRMAGAIIAEAVRRFAAEIQCEPAKSGLRISFSIDSKVQETMIVPRHVQKQLIDRFRSMAGLDVIDRSAPQSGFFTTAVDGKSHKLSVQYQPDFEGERLFIRID